MRTRQCAGPDRWPTPHLVIWVKLHFFDIADQKEVNSFPVIINLNEHIAKYSNLLKLKYEIFLGGQQINAETHAPVKRGLAMPLVIMLLLSPHCSIMEQKPSVQAAIV